MSLLALALTSSLALAGEAPVEAPPPAAEVSAAADAPPPADAAAPPVDGSTPSPAPEQPPAAPVDPAPTAGTAGEATPEPEAPADPEAPPTDPDAPPAIDISQALKTRDLTTSEVKDLQPKRWKLPQDPYGQTDFTAYALEWGEVKLGVTGITVGVLPRVQLGTNPVLYALKLPNAALKWNFVRAGPVDFAALGAAYVLPTPGFTGSFIEAGLMTSVQILPPWSFHLSGIYDHIGADGLPDFSQIPDILQTVSDATAELEANDTAIHLDANAFTVRAATDYRFNRRDSLLLRGQAIVWSGLTAHATSELPAIAGLDSILGQDKDSGTLVESIKRSYIVSISYQLTFKHVDLRGGYGGGALEPKAETDPGPRQAVTPFAWVLGAWDASYRLGGKTRLTETRMKKTWLGNLRDVKKARKSGKGTPTENAADKEKKEKKEKKSKPETLEKPETSPTTTPETTPTTAPETTPEPPTTPETPPNE